MLKPLGGSYPVLKAILRVPILLLKPFRGSYPVLKAVLRVPILCKKAYLKDQLEKDRDKGGLESLFKTTIPF